MNKKKKYLLLYFKRLSTFHYVFVNVVIYTTINNFSKKNYVKLKKGYNYYCHVFQLEFEFNEFKSRLKSPKTGFNLAPDYVSKH